jgi:hypothetical protein
MRMLELVLAFIAAISIVVIRALQKNNKKQEKDQTINEKELWPVSFYLVHEPKMEKQFGWFVTSEKYFETYDTRLLTGIGRKDAWRIIALATRTNNLERLTKNGFQAYKINGFVLKNRESKFVAKNGNGKLVSVQISQNTAFRILHGSKN